MYVCPRPARVTSSASQAAEPPPPQDLEQVGLGVKGCVKVIVVVMTPGCHDDDGDDDADYYYCVLFLLRLPQCYCDYWSFNILRNCKKSMSRIETRLLVPNPHEIPAP